MDTTRIKNITILGVGLIGGSLGLALKKRDFPVKLVGLGRRWSSLEIALAKGAVHQITLNFAEAIEPADMVVVCTTVETIPEMVQRVCEHAKDDCVITDVGSVKRQIVAEVNSFLPENLHFVGAHPMAGSEKRGATAAKSDLFEGANCILTPTEKTSEKSLQIVRALWESVGANTRVMSPAEHDFLIAAASHLPHLVACVLTQTVSEFGNEVGAALDFTATGFKDTTRIASGAPEIWQSILLQNSDMLIPMLEKFVANIEEFKRLLANKNEESIQGRLKTAKEIRDAVSGLR